MIDWSFVDFCLYLSTLPFFYLTWASGYMGLLYERAYKNRWGLSLVSASRWPRRASKHQRDLEREFDEA